MSGPIVRSGPTPEYSSNWEKAFAKKKTAKKKSSSKPAAKKASKRKKKA